MKYLNRQGDINETAKTLSIPIVYNWDDCCPRYCFVVPTYKRGSLLKYAINSILNQRGLDDYEILVVDDNPERNDETEKLMLSEFNIKKLAYFKNSRNLGQPGNWNKCFELSRAEWIIMLQDDDMLYPDFFELMKDVMSKYKYNIGGFFPAVARYTCSDGTMPCRMKSDMICRIIKLKDFLQGNILGAGALGMTLKRDIVLSMSGVNINSGPAVDYDFYNRLATVTDIVKLYNYPLGIWRTFVNVSQKPSTVLFCIEWGDVLKMDTLEACRLNWMKPLYQHYIKAFNEQHIRSWFKEMGKNKQEREQRLDVSPWDIMVYKLFRSFFVVRRHLRGGAKRISIRI